MTKLNNMLLLWVVMIITANGKQKQDGRCITFPKQNYLGYDGQKAL